MLKELAPGPLDSYAALIVRTDDEPTLLALRDQIAADIRLDYKSRSRLLSMIHDATVFKEDGQGPCPYCGYYKADHRPFSDCTGRD